MLAISLVLEKDDRARTPRTDSAVLMLPGIVSGLDYGHKSVIDGLYQLWWQPGCSGQ